MQKFQSCPYNSFLPKTKNICLVSYTSVSRNHCFVNSFPSITFCFPFLIMIVFSSPPPHLYPHPPHPPSFLVLIVVSTRDGALSSLPSFPQLFFVFIFFVLGCLLFLVPFRHLCVAPTQKLGSFSIFRIFALDLDPFFFSNFRSFALKRKPFIFILSIIYLNSPLRRVGCSNARTFCTLLFRVSLPSVRASFWWSCYGHTSTLRLVGRILHSVWI